MRQSTKTHPFVTRRVLEGFSLLSTLLLLPILCILCVGLLSLSAVSLRSGEREKHAWKAKANARLALSLALAQLQKAAGPDQRITAPANIVDSTAHPSVTGVWNSVKLDPSGEEPEKTGAFLTWLGSGSANLPTPEKTLPKVRTDSVSLYADVGSTSHRENPVVLPDGSRIAWTTSDESVKARVNLPKNEPEAAQVDTLVAARLRAPAAHDGQGIEGLDGLPNDKSVADKLISFSQIGLSVPDQSKVDSLRHDLTTWSESIPTNVVDGGLKADLSRLFEASELPSSFSKRHLYSGTDEPLVPSDPLFCYLADWYKLHRRVGSADSLGPLEMQIPSGYTPVVKKYNSATRSVTSSPRLQPLTSQLLAPVVTRVQVVFSLVVREPHQPWDFTSYDPELKYMAYLIYSPAVTVHNPYNTPITFRGLEVSFSNLPLAFQFYRNNIPQTSRPALLSQFHGLYENRSDWEDKFTARISPTAGKSADQAITLKPGEARIFGLSHAPGATWPRMLNFLYAGNQRSLTEEQLIPGPGWDYRCGFIVDVLRPKISGRINHVVPDYVLPLRGTDELDVACSLQPPADGKVQDFSVTISAIVNQGRSDIGVFSYRYGTKEKLEEALTGDPHPELGEVTFPFRRERAWMVPELYEPRSDATPFESWIGPKPFAIFSMAARTAKDSLHPSKPLRQGSFNHHVLEMDVTKSHPAQLPMEASFLPIRGNGEGSVGSIEIANDGTDRVYHFSGNTRRSGTLVSSTFEIPKAPPVNITEFKNAHLASSGHLPLVTQTIGDSHAHPAIPSDKAFFQKSTLEYAIADHSWLANHALWDGFYLSAITDEESAKSFFSGEGIDLNPRNVLFSRSPVKDQKIIEKIVSKDGWETMAAHQAIRGGFNVNSTSVAAWRAVLSSAKDCEIPVLDPETGKMSFYKPKNSPFPRLLYSSGRSIDEDQGSSTWNGFRELSDPQIESLAEAIVKEVKARGPFRSMSEFVNRRLGSSNDPATLAGTLESAIRASEVNASQKATAERSVNTQQANAFKYEYPEAATGDVEEGSNAYLSQGDLLSAIGSFITVRADTFVIRAYGESRSKDGVILSKAMLEAVVQRAPEFIDATNPPDHVQAATNDPERTIDSLSVVNRNFGRRFSVVGFRWLAASEVPS